MGDTAIRPPGMGVHPGRRRPRGVGPVTIPLREAAVSCDGWAGYGWGAGAVGLAGLGWGGVTVPGCAPTTTYVKPVPGRAPTTVFSLVVRGSSCYCPDPPFFRLEKA